MSHNTSITNEQGIISKLGGKFIFKSAKDGKQYDPGNSLESKYKRVGSRVIVSGTVGEIPPNAVGIPLTITNISPISSGRSGRKK